MAILNSKPFAHPEVFDCLAGLLGVAAEPPGERRRVVKEWLQDHSNGLAKQFAVEGRAGRHVYRVTLDLTKRVRVDVEELTGPAVGGPFGGHPAWQAGLGRGGHRWFTVKFVFIEVVA